MKPSAALPAADPIPRVLAWCRTHPAVVALTGPGEHVGLANEPPWPHIAITDPPGTGSSGPQIWHVARDLQIEVLGDLQAFPGKAALSTLMSTVVGALMEIPDEQAPPGVAVITAVQVLSSGGWVPLADGQPRYVALVRVWSHPPN